MTTEYDIKYRMQAPQSGYYPEDSEIDDWFSQVRYPALNVLVGPPKCGKTSFSVNHGIQFHYSKYFQESVREKEDTDIYTFTGSWKKSELVELIHNKKSIIYDAENLSKRERYEFLRHFNNGYRKTAIVWELPEDELIRRGCDSEEVKQKLELYDRPDFDEGFDDITFII